MISTRRLAVLLFLILPSIAACAAGEPAATEVVTQQVSGSAGTYTLGVLVRGEQVLSLTVPELLGMPQVALNDSSVERGPTLLSVLDRAEVQDFDEVVVTGLSPGRAEPVELRLSRRDVDEQVIFGLTNRGTAKFAGANIPRDQWVIDVQHVDVEGNVGSGTNDYFVRVIRDGKNVASLRPGELRALPAVSFGGQEGPTLLSILASIGIDEFTSVKLIGVGVGRTDPAELTLANSALTNQTILDFTRRGTMKLTSPDIDRAHWVLDVTQIVVE